MEITQKEIRERYFYRDGHLFYRKTINYNAQKGKQAGYLRSDGRIEMNIGGILYYEHRLIFFYHYGYFPKEIDHIDRNNTNNHIQNLRDITHSHNQSNKEKRKGTLSRFKGVTFDKFPRRNPWTAQITINGHHKHLGHFFTETEAAKAYDKASLEGFGEFAYTNKQAGLLETEEGIL